VPFRLSTAAAGDLDRIRVYTLERWGRAQWLAYYLAYYNELARTFERIAAEPWTGRRRDGFRPGMRSAPCRARVVFYVELGGGVIGILRVLHARQNAAALRWEEGIEI
jgi:plasmid stabilization system protein ParE